MIYARMGYATKDHNENNNNELTKIHKAQARKKKENSQINYISVRFLKTLHFSKKLKRITCHGLSQSSGIGQAPNHAPIIAPYAGRQII